MESAARKLPYRASTHCHLEVLGGLLARIDGAATPETPPRGLDSGRISADTRPRATPSSVGWSEMVSVGGNGPRGAGEPRLVLAPPAGVPGGRVG